MVFTPKHTSWLNQGEIFFSTLTRRLLKHGRFTSPEDPATQMLAFVEYLNQTARPDRPTIRLDIHQQGPRSMKQKTNQTPH